MGNKTWIIGPGERSSEKMDPTGPVVKYSPATASSPGPVLALDNSFGHDRPEELVAF
jgi:hypothetical protein